MADTHALSALAAKYAELSGELDGLERRTAQLRADLAHLDAVIRLFDLDARPEAIAPKALRHRRGWFSDGELPRLVLDVLRTAPEPMTAREIALALTGSKGLDVGDERAMLTVEKRVDGALRRRRDGLVERVGLGGRSVGWRVRREG